MKKYFIVAVFALVLVGCMHKAEKPTSFESPVPSIDEIETSGNPFEEESITKETTEEDVSEEPNLESSDPEASTLLEEDQTEEVIEANNQIKEERSYVLMPENSEFYWKAGKVIGSTHEGLIPMQGGALILTPEGNILGDFSIQMNEMINLDLDEGGAEKLISHLKSDDFFSTEKFPTANFVVTGSEEVTEDTFNITGDLAIKGITNPITFKMKFINIEGILVAIADINIDRTKWDIRYGSGKFFDDLGDNMIKDIFETKITLSFIPAEALE